MFSHTKLAHAFATAKRPHDVCWELEKRVIGQLQSGALKKQRVFDRILNIYQVPRTSVFGYSLDDLYVASNLNPKP